MSPEQLHRGVIDGRSDLYSLSAVFYELLCLKKVAPRIPSLDSLIDTVSRNDAAQVDAVPNDHQSYVPSEYTSIVHKGLSTEPDDRFQTAMECLICLERYRADISIPCVIERF